MKNKYFKILFLFVLIIISILTIKLIFQSEYIKVQYVGDDTFYYLNSAKYFVKNGNWSFDRYGTPSTGFHLLNAYLLAFFYWVFGEKYFIFSQLFYLFTTIIFLVYLLKRSKKNIVALLIITLVLSSLSTFINILSLMEWIWVVIISFFLFENFYYKKNGNFLLFFLALLGVLARSDFIILTLSFFIVTFLKIGKHCRKAGILILLGGVLGFFLYVVHNYFISGNSFQSSATIKLYRSLHVGISPFPFLLQSIRAFIGFNRLSIFSNTEQRILFFNISAIFLIILGIGSFYYFRENIKVIFKIRLNDNKKLLLILSLFSFFLYLIFYSFNSFGMQIWYNSFAIVPLSILLYFVLIICKKKITKIIMVILVFFNLHQLLFTKGFNKGQEKALDLALTIGKEFNITEHTFGAWDCGILGYYLEGSVVNLDGLANAEVIPYIKGDSLFTYIKKKKIDILLQEPPIKGDYYGYDLLKLKSRLFEKIITSENGNSFNIYEVK